MSIARDAKAYISNLLEEAEKIGRGEEKSLIRLGYNHNWNSNLRIA
jgi:hypothetical protein